LLQFIYFIFLLSTKFSALLPKSIPKTKYQLQFTEGTGENKHDWINVKCTLHDVLCAVLCAVLGTIYIYSKVLLNFWLCPIIYISKYIYVFIYIFFLNFSIGLQTTYLDWHLL